MLRRWPYWIGFVVLCGVGLGWCETGLTSFRHAANRIGLAGPGIASSAGSIGSSGRAGSSGARWELADRATEFRTALFDSALPLRDRVAAAELLRLSILIELREDAAAVAHGLTEGTAALVEAYPDDRLALATHQDALRTLLWLSEQARLPDVDVDADLVESIHDGIAVDPENGHSELLAAVVALGKERVDEARDALADAARSERIDSTLRDRFHATVDFLIRRGVPRSKAEEVLTIGGYGAASLRPGEALESLARDLVRKGGMRFANDENRWFEGWVALHGIGGALANSTLLVEDALDATHADTAFLDEMTSLVPRLIPRDESARRAMIDARLRAMPRDDLHVDSVERADRAALGRPEFIGEILRRLEIAHRELERTRSLDQFVAAQSILTWWCGLTLFTLVVLFVLGRRRKANVPEPPAFFRGLAIALPAILFFFLIGSGLPPFHRGGGVERVLRGLAEPNALLLVLPFVGLPVLLVPGFVSRKYWRREALVNSAVRVFVVIATILLLLFGVTARSLDGMRERRNTAVRDLWVETWTNRFDAKHGITNS